jgi:hypothetical protein
LRLSVRSTQEVIWCGPIMGVLRMA